MCKALNTEAQISNYLGVLSLVAAAALLVLGRSRDALEGVAPSAAGTSGGGSRGLCGAIGVSTSGSVQDTFGRFKDDTWNTYAWIYASYTEM